MRILFAGTELAGFEDALAAQVRVNGQIATETVEIVNAAHALNFGDGNLAQSLQFRARREFPTIKAAEKFLLTHFAGLAKEGHCEIQCGTSEGDHESVWLPCAVLQAMPEGGYEGVSVTASYTILFSEVSLTDPDGEEGGDE
jgi:hypothetical protein